MKTSPWITIYEDCACRIIDGGDVKNVADRVAFIEKSPRVRFADASYPFDLAEDRDKWGYGIKGSDGFDEESRAWCDQKLIEMGYELG